MPEQKSNKGDFDIFIANDIYPEAESIFGTELKPLEEIKDDCYVVLDTNALLVPYTIGKDTLEQIKQTFQTLVENGRLIVPGQVAREFAKNRANKLSDLFKELSKKRDEIPKLQKGMYPLLESLEEYQETIKLEKDIDELLREYRKAISKVLDYIHDLTWNDPVSLLYKNLFSTGVVLDINIDKDKTRSELHRRQQHNIPPGYKDASKLDEGIGDLLIWQTILEVGKEKNKSVIFVSGDGKTDWWHQSNKQSLYPRYELIDEFRRISEGQSFHIITFSRFLNLYGASEKVVEEVRKEEVQARVEQSYGSAKSKLVLLYSEIDRELREFLAGSGSIGEYKPHSLRGNLEVLERRGSLAPSLMSSADHFLGVYNQVLHDSLINSDAMLPALDSGVAILKAIQAIPIEINVVYHPHVELYADENGTQIRQGVHGILLETTSPGGASKKSIFPTTRTHFTKGKRVAWEWDLSFAKVWDKTWYRDPDTGEIQPAWLSSGEFIGRHMDEL